MTVAELKESILCQLVTAGGSHLVTNDALSDEGYRAVAELVVDGKIYDQEEPQGLLLVITRWGLEAVKP